MACGVGSPPLWSCKHAGQAVRFPAPTERSARQAGSVVALAGISSYTRLPVGGRDSPREAVTEGSLGLTFLTQVGWGGGQNLHWKVPGVGRPPPLPMSPAGPPPLT